MDANALHGQWGYHLESEILLLNELKEPNAASRRELANRLKPIISAPPEYIEINRKNMAPYKALNRAFVLAFTNEQSTHFACVPRSALVLCMVRSAEDGRY